MEALLDQLWTAIKQQLETNQFLSGGAVLMVLGATAALCRALPGKIWDWFTRRIFIEFEISMRDDAFWWFNDWLAAQPYSKNWARWMSVRTVRKGRRGRPSYEGDGEKPTIILSPAPGTHWLWWKGYFLIVRRERKENPNAATPGQSVSLLAPEIFNVSVLTWRRGVIEKLIEECRDVAEPPDDDRVRIYMARYGEWSSETKRRPRPLNSVILKDGFMDNLLNDARKFLVSEQWYNDRGIPYRRGYLFHGPPGNGKSSIIMALASALKLDICVLNLTSASMGDDELRQMFASVPENAIVAIEDVDCVFQQRSKDTDSKDSKITFSGLLNAIDGLAAGEGRILIMTTNFVDKLDAALVRPGRCDVRFLIQNADADQAERLFLRFFPAEQTLAKEFSDRTGNGQYSMAALQGQLLRYADNPLCAVSTLSELLNESQAADQGSERTQGELGVQTEVCVGSDA